MAGNGNAAHASKEWTFSHPPANVNAMTRFRLQTLLLGLAATSICVQLGHAKKIPPKAVLESQCSALLEDVKKRNPKAEQTTALVLSRREYQKQSGDLLEASHPWICKISYHLDEYEDLKLGKTKNATVTTLWDAVSHDYIGRQLQGEPGDISQVGPP